MDAFKINSEIKLKHLILDLWGKIPTSKVKLI